MFKKAVKHEAKLRLAIAGPSGGGKTYTALAIGTRLGSRVAVVDTEHGSASKYADLFEFDTLQLAAPFHPDRFTEAIKAAESAGYDVVIIDSLSHAWNGSGGALELVEQFSRKYKGNSYAAWGDVTPIQNRLIEAIVGANLHIIGTMRSKQDYILVEKNGKSMPQKVGMAPVQRDGFEYEFDVFLDMDIENNAIVSKTRCPALTGKVLPKPGNDVAAILTDWLKGVARPEQVSPPRQVEAPKPNGNGQRDEWVEPVKIDTKSNLFKSFMATGSELYGDEWDDKRPQLVRHISKGQHTSSAELSFEQVQTLLNGMQDKLMARDQEGEPA